MIGIKVTGFDGLEDSINNTYLQIEKSTKAKLPKIANIIKMDLVEYAKFRAWKNLSKQIKSEKIDDKTYQIYIPDDKWAKISDYQHFGTEPHFIAPVKAKALHWLNGGSSIFSLGHKVSGIKATNYFRITENALNRILGELSNIIT